jgi:hypothetical protein
MSADRGQLRTMRLLPFTAAADEAAWVADPGTIVGRGQSLLGQCYGRVRGGRPSLGTHRLTPLSTSLWGDP